jgi:hypothetical protein
MQGQLHGCRRVGRRGQGRDAMPQRDDSDGVGACDMRCRSATGERKVREVGEVSWAGVERKGREERNRPVTLKQKKGEWATHEKRLAG